MPLLVGRGQSIGSHEGPAMVSSLTCALLPSTTTPLSEPVIMPGPFTVIPVSSGATLTPRDANSGIWQLPANPGPVHERVCPARSRVRLLAVNSIQVLSTTAMSAASAYAPGAPSVRHPLTGVGPAIAVDGDNVSTASVTANTTAAERLEYLIPQPLVDCLSCPGESGSQGSVDHGGPSPKFSGRLRGVASRRGFCRAPPARGGPASGMPNR